MAAMECEKRTRVPQVLVLGMPRTALRVALRKMGYGRQYYWDTVIHNKQRGDAAEWQRLIEQKFDGTSSLIAKERLDALLGGYDSLADFPSSLFAEDLITAYPDAKVILTVRDSPDVWYRSFNSTVWKYHTRKIWPKTLSERLWALTLKNNPCADLMRTIIFRTPMLHFPRQGIRWYLDHNEAVRKLVPADRLLEFNAKDGWDPLCEFLGVQRPPGDYPLTNGTDTFQTAVDQSWVVWKVRYTQYWFKWLSVSLISLSVMFVLLEMQARAAFGRSLTWLW